MQEIGRLRTGAKLAHAEAETAHAEAAAAHAEAEAAIVAARGDAGSAIGAARADAGSAIAATRAEADVAIAATRAEADVAIAAARTEADVAIAAAQSEAEVAIAAAQSEAEAAIAAARTEAGTDVAAARADAAVARAETGAVRLKLEGDMDRLRSELQEYRVEALNTAERCLEELKDRYAVVCGEVDEGVKHLRAQLAAMDQTVLAVPAIFADTDAKIRELIIMTGAPLSLSDPPTQNAPDFAIVTKEIPKSYEINREIPILPTVEAPTADGGGHAL
jgi:hypothetical protein